MPVPPQFVHNHNDALDRNSCPAALPLPHFYLGPVFLYSCIFLDSSNMADLSRIESMQYPAGHLSHLSENQQAALETFKEICEKEGYWTPRTGEKEASHDDETMLYELPARPPIMFYAGH